MKFKLSELRILSQSLSKLVVADLPIKVSYRIAKFSKRVSEEMRNIESARIKLIDKYGEKVESMNTTAVSKENEEKFYKEFSDFLSEEVDIAFDPISYKEIDNVRLSAADLLNLEKVIVE